jgi:hypothetical protein
MPTNLDRYKSDLERLSASGTMLLVSMAVAIDPKRKKEFGLTDQEAKDLPVIEHEYQRWYSEALACISHIADKGTGFCKLL